MWDATQSLGKRILSTLLLVTATGVLFLYYWIELAINKAHVMPTVEQKDISAMVSGRQYLSQEELKFLAEQTGLGENTIMDLQKRECAKVLLEIQRIYFAPVEIESIKTTPLTISEWLAEDPIPGYEGMPMVDIQNGDILITKNSRFLGWRNGHAGLVVDAEKGLVLEAIMLGSPSQLCNISKWESYPSFLVLRLREEYMLPEEADGEQGDTMSIVGSDSIDDTTGTTAENVAAYASQHLVGVPYQLLAGVFSRELYRTAKDTDTNVSEIATEALSGTQCAHLVWYAYKQFGIDLDSDGGLFVTPYDIQNSPYLEVMQSYGY